MLRKVGLVLALLVFGSAAFAQTGQLAPGQVWGNAGSAQAPASPTGIVSLLNKACSLSPGTCAFFFGYYNPIWYGADPTGATSSTTAINSAVAAACGTTASLGSGATVWIQPGIYLTNGGINLTNIQNSCHVKGAGIGSTEFTLSSATNTMIDMVGTASVTVSGIYLNPNGFATYGIVLAASSINACDVNHIDNVSINGSFGEIPLYIYGCSDGSFNQSSVVSFNKSSPAVVFISTTNTFGATSTYATIKTGAVPTGDWNFFGMEIHDLSTFSPATTSTVSPLVIQGGSSPIKFWGGLVAGSPTGTSGGYVLFAGAPTGVSFIGTQFYADNGVSGAYAFASNGSSVTGLVVENCAFLVGTAVFTGTTGTIWDDLHFAGNPSWGALPLIAPASGNSIALTESSFNAQGQAINLGASGVLTNNVMVHPGTITAGTNTGNGVNSGGPGDATNFTGTASGLTAGHVTTNANLTGDVTSSGNATTLTNAPVIAKVLTGFTSGSGTVSSADSILTAIQKLNGNDGLNLPLAGGTMTGNIAMGGHAITGAVIAGVGGRNILIDGDFRINQRAYVSAATLAAGAYGHDRWKAGASGGDYSFTQLKSSTQITIAASKTLIQVVEDANVIGGSYALSWTGTCQARAGLNTATPSGSFAASPVLITGQTAGTVMSVEFGNGASACTLGTVQLEAGTAATTFEYLPLPVELVKSQRYFEVISAASNGAAGFGVAQCSSTGAAALGLTWKVQKRIAPTVTLSAFSDWSFYNSTISSFVVWASMTTQTTEWGGLLNVSTVTAGLGGSGQATMATPNGATTAARIFINAEL